MQGQAPDHRAHQLSLRISDQDRHQVAEVLRRAAGDGRIDLEELDQRLEATYGAKTYADLVPITADLPVHPAAAHQARPAPTSMTPAATYDSSVAVMGDCTRRGAWRVPDRHTAFALMGSVTLDLREALFSAREMTIFANAVMASIDVVVNPGTAVVVEGTGVMGDFSEARAKAVAQLGPESPVVRVKGIALMGSVTVRRKPMPGEDRKLLGRFAR
jgi:hypothetical protein